MPHIIVKMHPGRTGEQKKILTEKIVADVVAVAGCKETSVSVAIEEVEPDDWPEAVYRPDILEGDGVLYKEPGYNPFGVEPEKEAESDKLMTYVRNRAEAARQQDTTGYFSPMSWLDLELEDNPASFDGFFDKPWQSLSEEEKAKRAMVIRRVL